MKLSKERFDNLSPLKKALFKIEKYKVELSQLKEKKIGGDIAIIGMSLKFPNAENPEQFWDNLINKKDHITSFPKERKKKLKYYYKGIGREIDDLDFQEGAYLKKIDHFDYEFFKFPPVIAATTHPLQRLYLQTSWKALEDAGCLNSTCKKVGIYFGASGDISYSQYLNIIEHSEHRVNPAVLMGNTNSIASSRLSYFLDLKGPAVTLDTACSSSLVAVHIACNSLLAGDCDIAIAGGGKLYILPEKDKYHIGFESPTGKTKPFDINSDGAGIGEGVASIVMKPLGKAIANNDQIYAVIKGSAINQDGTSAGITAPNPKAQTNVILEAAKRANIDIETISYIETHGTGTQLGDPVEFQALKEAFGLTKKRQFCALGAVKSNIGHLFEAAGIAGLIKCVLALQKQVLPASINHHDANINIDFENSPFYLNTNAIPWDTGKEIKRCGVSSFGISGTNAHVILEQFENNNHKEKKLTDKSTLFTLSAHTKETLELLITEYNKWLENDSLCLQNVSYATNVKRGVYDWRFAVIVDSIEDLKLAFNSAEKFICKSKDRYIIDKSVIINYKNSKQNRAKHELEVIASEFLMGGVIDWDLFYLNSKNRKIWIPPYPLKKMSCWPKFNPNKRIELENVKVNNDKLIEPLELTYDDIYLKLAKMIEVDTGMIMKNDMIEVDFFDLGVDSIIIMQFIQTINKEYCVKLEMGQFYEEVNNLGKLIKFILDNGNEKEKRVIKKETSKIGYKTDKKIDYFVPYKKIVKNKSKQFDENQIAHLNGLSDRIIKQTKKSKVTTQKFRKVLANNRNVAGFRPETKEITYQIIAKSAKGARIQDIDGNEYVDLTMGFGVNLLGYNPEFVELALQASLKQGYPVGPMSDTAGQVASLISEMTGNDRVAFYNSGSEAVMVALRLARTITGKSKFVLFKESYHGTFDGILALNNPLDPLNPIPLAPGISDNYIENTIVLEYGTKESLATIKEHAHELAGVLVEPVQSRRPNLQPKEFLNELRKITELSGSALIFDEVITGFRIQPGGAQQWYDIKADICTYGKIVGGGMPIGVVAGSSTYMDAIDGGHWQFGDDSYPDKLTTFVAGTFNQHPLTMTASLQILTYLKEQGAELQNNLNEKTNNLVGKMNRFFEKKMIPIKVVNFGSLFRFVLKGGWELLYQHLLANKIYVWEGRNCFLSTAHTDEDIEFIYESVVKATSEILESGFMTIDLQGKTTEQNQLSKIMLSEEQEQLFALSASSDQSSSSFNENQIVDLHGELNIKVLKKTINSVVNRHEALRTIKIENSYLYVIEKVEPIIEILDWEQLIESNRENDSDLFFSKQGSIPFNLSDGPFIRFILLKIAPEHHRLLMTTHHLVADGYSLEIIWSELSKSYSAEKDGNQVSLLPAASIRVFNDWIKKPALKKNAIENTNFWIGEFKKKYPIVNLPSNFKPSFVSKKGHSFSKSINRELKSQLVKFARSNKLTLFNVFLSVYNIMIYKLSGQSQFIVGIPSSGQLLMGEKKLVGQCVKMLPLYNEIDNEINVVEYLSSIKSKISQIIKHQQCSFNEIIQSDENLKPPKITTEIDMNSIKNQLEFDGLTTEFSFPTVNFVKYDLSISIIEMESKLSVEFFYNTGLFEYETIESWATGFMILLKDIIENPTKKVMHLTMEDERQIEELSAWNNL